MLATTPAPVTLAVPQQPSGTAAFAVRPAVATDVAALTRIYNESLPEQTVVPVVDGVRIGGRLLATSRLSRLPDDGLSGWMTAHATNGRPLWLAHVGGEPVGWLSLLGFSDRPACTCAGEVAIYIARGWQGQGVGRTLVGHAMKEAPQWGIDRLMAFIWHDNMGSRRLFEKCGFEPWGTLPGVVWAEGVGRDMLIVGRSL